MWPFAVSLTAVVIIIAIVSMLRSSAKSEGKAEQDRLHAIQRREQRLARDKILAEPVADEAAWLESGIRRAERRRLRREERAS